jgi:hypothetical protein
LPAQTSESIYSLAVTSEEIRLRGLTKEQLLLIFYKAAAISKINIDTEDMKALITISEHQLEKPMSNRAEHQSKRRKKTISKPQLKKPKSNRAEHRSKRPKKTVPKHQLKKPKNTRGTR